MLERVKGLKVGRGGLGGGGGGGGGGGWGGVLVEVVGGAVTRCHEVCQGCELGMCGRGVREGCVF